MVGAVAIRPVFTDETALSLYQKNIFLDRYYSPAPERVLIPDIVEDREPPCDSALPGYDRFGRINRMPLKGLFVDSYH
jgi:hypothetical protein